MPVPVGDLPALLGQIHAALKSTVSEDRAPEKSEALKPAVAIKKSVAPDYIISLEDGRKFKSLKRHLATHYGLTPDEYRAKWGLPADYRFERSFPSFRFSSPAKRGQDVSH